MKTLFNWSLFVLCVFIAFLTAYGGYQLYTHKDRTNEMKIRQAKIISLENKVNKLRRIGAYTEIMEQVLTDQQLDEMKALNERVRQSRHRASK